MIINDVDPGGIHPFPKPVVGQTLGSALIEGSRTIIWPRGAIVEKQTVTFYATAWQGIGGQPAGSFLALRYLLRQLEELAQNPDLQPCFIQWAATAQSGQYNVTTPHDGWYVIEDLEPDYENFIVGGTVKVSMTVDRVAAASPASLATWYAGGALSSTYSGAATALIGFPLGSTAQAPTALSRTGAEGAIPLSASPVPNPVPFVRPGTIAGLFQGGVRVFDTINTGSNPVSTSGGIFNANWVQVYGTAHDFVGDCIITNGLLLLLFQVGAGITVYVWNTSLSPPAWQSAGGFHYNDGAFNDGTVREINLDRVGLEVSRARVVLGTSAGNYALLRWKLQRGQYGALVEFWPLTQANSTGYGLRWALAAGKIGYNESAVADIAVTANASLATTSALGFAAAFATAANGPIVGWLYENAPSSAQGLGGAASTDWAFGDASGPAVAGFRLYGIFAIPFGSNGASVEKLQAEAESGALGTGWSSVADAAASNGNAAKAASGTTAGNADLFGTSWVPPPGQYGIGFRAKVTSAASTTPIMRFGWWDVTAGAFVPLGASFYAPSQWATTYGWLLANWRQVTDGVLNGTTTVTSATAIFSAADDTGKAISGAGIPAGTTIASVTNTTTIILSQAATSSASGVTLSIGGPVAAPAGHNVQFRVVPTAALPTDFVIDEAAALPIRSATLGVGSFPGDVWSQFLFDKVAAWARG